MLPFGGGGVEVLSIWQHDVPESLAYVPKRLVSMISIDMSSMKRKNGPFVCQEEGSLQTQIKKWFKTTEMFPDVC